MAGLVGKVVANAVYVVPENVATLPDSYLALIEKAEGLTEDASTKYNVLKISPKTSQVSFLEYDDLLKSPFPVLRHSVAVNVETTNVTQRSYKTRDNPPILHRKEVLLGKGHPDYEDFALLTRTLEGLGLFGETSRIGTQQEWGALLKSIGITLQDHLVVRSDEKLSDASIARHRTALVRSSLSAPIEAALKFELLTSERTVFDFGCGRGDDVALLTADGYDAVGWDPYYAPDGIKRTSDIVNLGYVLNVIEDPTERVHVVRDAYDHAGKVLLVAALIDGQKSRSQAKRYRDGVITKRGTFQKFFTQMELRELIETSVKTEAISVGPGLFLVIRDEAERETFLRTRHRRASRNVLPLISSRAKRVIELTSDEDKELAGNYWELACELGRLPRRAELPSSLADWVTQKFGNPKKASAWLVDHFGRENLERAAQQKKDQLLCYLALAVFRRKKFRSLMTAELRRDIKRMFGTLKDAEDEAVQTLRSIADTEILANDSMAACDYGCAQIDSKGRLIVHTGRVSELPSSLQVVIGIAEWLGDDLSSVDIVSVGAANAVVTFSRFRNFPGEPFPMREERLRVNLIKQSVRYIPEQSTKPPRLFIGKNDLLVDQDDRLALLENAIKTMDPESYSARMVDVESLLRIIGQTGQIWEGVDLRQFFESLPHECFDLKSSGYLVLDNAVLPAIDDPCGRYFCYRDFIECGETQERTGLENRPKQPESFGALSRLADQVLDPVIDEYGMIKLTYGFGSPELARNIPARIAPKIDQHVAHELNRRGNLVCTRLGAAVDFLVEFESMLEVAQWIVRHCAFDRLYFYSDERPIHVSVGPNESRDVVLLTETEGGRKIPRRVEKKIFLAKTPALVFTGN